MPKAAATSPKKIVKVAPRKRANGCACIDKANRALADRKVRLRVAIEIASPVVRVVIETEPLAKGGRRIALTPTYCPFCGKPYPP